MGAGASTISADTEKALQGLPEASNADIAALANTMVPTSSIAPETKAAAVRIAVALATEDGWKELQALFRSLSVSLDDAISSEEWGSIIHRDEGLRKKYFGDASPEEIATQFDGLDEEGKSELVWEEFVDGAVSLGAVVTLCEQLASAEGEAELRQLFETVLAEEPDDLAGGRLSMLTWAAVLKEQPDLLKRFTGLDGEASARFQAFFMIGRVDTWIGKIFRRLGLHEDGCYSWDEFFAATASQST
uniref:Uncharacterized protein n=1 Tax=Haptolina brevifila TaxID=156173 RepID=A0A7S2N419_9EUKA|mmetsp:Transcript_65799/g.130399  ORF Transcript_65799/g.130399 Transcript_65799/m.130399 type:complete len:246 (+) Transcript_65799:183-920(+)|eukprot:CAMPEP_0174698516 /NCGR_PEP_ID=MMETSP1094-20130205/4098_1 /TAXON_ID=156173 /ORGANISM="Chrysochromulina brevifilum, Strain UTEX LB 985" /LENGTH=245 /DNA_ID=CAMNT_0015895707 /DNA_START=131 /DNA_END=868 /DNA_ORIENTATION=-